jgi:hypothetical protein
MNIVTLCTVSWKNGCATVFSLTVFEICCIHVRVVNQSVVVTRGDSAVVTRLRALPVEAYWNSRQ